MKNNKLGFTPLDRHNKLDGRCHLTGFTLLELMIAAGILLIVISGLLVTFVHCILLNESNNNLVVAANDAQYVLEQVCGGTYSNISSYSPPALNNLDNETIVLQRSIGAKIAEITVNVSWTQRQGQKSFQLSTLKAKAE